MTDDHDATHDGDDDRTDATYDGDDDRTDATYDGDDRIDASERDPEADGPVVDRRDVLGTLAGATLTPALAGAVRAENTESTDGLPLDRLTELPADGDGLPELLESTPGDTDRFRELSWSAMSRNHLEWYPEIDYEEAAPDPLWHGQTVTQLTLVDAAWEDFGNPDTDDDDEGCYRYTFQLQSMAMELTPARFDLEANDFGVQEEYGFVPLAEGLPDLPTDAHRRFFRRQVDQAWAELGNEVTVQMPELQTEEGEEWDGRQQHLALSARRDQDLFAAINGSGIVQQLRDDAQALQSFQDNTAPLLDTLDEAAVVNARQRMANHEERQRDQKAILDGTMSLLGLAAFGVLIFFTGPIAIIAGAVGTALTVAGLVLGIVSLGEADDEPLPYYRGFELKLSPAEDQAIAGHHVTFDAYVTPGLNEGVTFDVRSKHERDDLGIEALADVTWGIELDPPASNASEEDIWAGASIEHATTWEFGDAEYVDPPEPGEPGTRDVATKGPVPGLAMTFDEESGDVTIDDIPVMSFFDTAGFDAYDTILHDSAIEEYRWAIYRVGDYVERYHLEDTLAAADLSHSSWPPEPDALTVVDTGRGETFEFTPKLESRLEIDDPQPGTYLVALAVDDGSLSNFTYEPFLVGGVPFPYIYTPDVTDGIGDPTDDHPTFPTGATVSFSGDYRNPTEIEESDFETFWLVPDDANPQAQLPEGPNGTTRSAISDDYIVRGGLDAEIELTEPGVYEAEFRAYGENGVYEKATTTVEVVRPTTAIDYELSEAVQVDLDVVDDASTFELGDTVTLSASNAEAHGPLELLGFDWDTNGDGTYTDLDGDNAEGSLREVERELPRGRYGFTEPGDHEFGVLAYAYDPEAAEVVGNTARTTVTVQSTGEPTARITRLAATDGSVLEIKEYIRRMTREPFWETRDHVAWFSAANSELADSAERFRWWFHDTDDVHTRSLTSTGPVWHTFQEPGTYEVELEVWYSDGSTVQTSTTVDVE